MPHARILAVHTEAASAVEGVLGVVTGRDLHEVLGDRIYTGPAFSDQPCLAVDKVRYVGEAVAAVLATDLATARAAADEISVEYEELPPVYDIPDGLRGDSFVHDELRPSSVFADLAHLRGVRDTNVCYEYRQLKGDAAADHARAATTVSARTGPRPRTTSRSSSRRRRPGWTATGWRCCPPPRRPPTSGRPSPTCWTCRCPGCGS